RASALNQKRRTQTVCSNRGTLHVPTWAARAKRGLPRWLAIARSAPQQRIQRIFFAFALRISTALRKEGFHRCAVVIGLVAKLLGGIDRRVNIGILCVIHDIGSAIIEEFLRQTDNFIDRFDGANVIPRWNDPELFHI